MYIRHWHTVVSSQINTHTVHRPRNQSAVGSRLSNSFSESVSFSYTGETRRRVDSMMLLSFGTNQRTERGIDHIATLLEPESSAPQCARFSPPFADDILSKSERSFPQLASRHYVYVTPRRPPSTVDQDRAVSIQHSFFSLLLHESSSMPRARCRSSATAQRTHYKCYEFLLDPAAHVVNGELC